MAVRGASADLGQWPDGDPAPAASAAAAAPGAPRRPFITQEVWSLGEVMRSGRFRVLVLALCGGSGRRGAR